MFFQFSLDIPQDRCYNSQNKFIAERIITDNAGVAQLVEQLICNQPVGGSNPLTSSIFFKGLG